MDKETQYISNPGDITAIENEKYPGVTIRNAEPIAVIEIQTHSKTECTIHCHKGHLAVLLKRFGIWSVMYLTTYILFIA